MRLILIPNARQLELLKVQLAKICFIVRISLHLVWYLNVFYCFPICIPWTLCFLIQVSFLQARFEILHHIQCADLTYVLSWFQNLLYILLMYYKKEPTPTLCSLFGTFLPRTLQAESRTSRINPFSLVSSRLKQ